MDYKKHLVAKVGFKKANYFVGLQERGGTKRAKKGKIVVPISTAKLAKKYKKSGGAKEFLNAKKMYSQENQKDQMLLEYGRVRKG